MSSSQPPNQYLVLQQPIFVVPDAATSSARFRNHHSARLHVFHMVWHCQEPPECHIPEAEMSPALGSGGSRESGLSGQRCSHLGSQHPRFWTLQYPKCQSPHSCPKPPWALLQVSPYFPHKYQSPIWSTHHTHVVPCPRTPTDVCRGTRWQMHPRSTWLHRSLQQRQTHGYSEPCRLTHPNRHTRPPSLLRTSIVVFAKRMDARRYSEAHPHPHAKEGPWAADTALKSDVGDGCNSNKNHS